ncbi:MAG TPA: phage portal protein [Ignavibacteriaceae bacterium]
MSFFNVTRKKFADWLSYGTKANNNYNVRWTISKTGEWVYPDSKSDTYIDKGYKELPNVYGLIEAITSKSTIVPFEVFKVKSKSKELKYKAFMDSGNYVKAMLMKAEAYEKVEGSMIEQMLLRPNDYQTTKQLNEEIDGYFLLTGNAYVYALKVGSTGELHSIPSPCVDIKVSGGPFTPTFNYQVNYLENTIKGEEMLHFKKWNPITSGQSPSKQYKGLSPLQSCRLLLGRYKNADLTQGFQFENMGPGGMITGASTSADGLTEEQATAIQDKFKQQHQGVHKAGDILVTPSALTWTAFGLSAVDLNILASKTEMINELCNVYQYPSDLMGGDKKYNNFAEARKAVITDAVIPVVESRKGVYNKYIKDVLKEDLVIEYDYTIFPEMQDDLEKQSRVAMSSYLLTIDERRSLMGYDQLKESERKNVIVPSGLSTLDTLYETEEIIEEDFEL